MPVGSNSTTRDLSSLANPHQVRVKHLDWDFRVDFDDTIFRASATYTYERVDAACNVLQLDTSELKVKRVSDTSSGSDLDFSLKKKNERKPHLGQQLEIVLTPTKACNSSAKEHGRKETNPMLSGSMEGSQYDATGSVRIEYETKPSSSAIQWLPPAQTAGRVHPYLFTQCQAIHARSMLPCQDQPGTKMTFKAVANVPSWATCVMSGLLRKESASEDASEKQFFWEQPVPVSSYLIALAVGDLVKKDISVRCAIWTEPALVDAAAYEFSQTETFLSIAEELAGMPYVWGRYDLLCLPPSFPYGGMENPCLTFVTPTLLAGDRSLADVVAHEIAHSWTGNLVTNATWDHFWLNEGWTTWFQRKIMARIHKDDKFLDFDAIGGYKTLQDTIQREMPRDFQKLVLPIGDQDPDDAYSSVAYEKGFNLLMALERRVGKKMFESFFQAYVSEFARKPLTSDDFKKFFLQHFSKVEAVNDVDWVRWFHEPGMPPEVPTFDRSLAEASENLAKEWISFDRTDETDESRFSETDLESWSSNQITCFLDALQTHTATKPLKQSTLKVMDDIYGFSQTTNAEILLRLCQISIATEDESMLAIITYFITSQGRMKYVRPLYRALFASDMGKELAVQVFLKHKDFYHPICSKMIAMDLKLTAKASANSFSKIGALFASPCSIAIVAVAVTVGLYISRRK